MAKKRRLFFFDIDGTIQAEDDGYIPESTIDAIRQLRSKGHGVVINTGRVKMNVREDIRSIGFDAYIYGCGTEVEVGGKTIFRNKLNKELCRVLANAVRSCGAVPLYERSDAMYYDSFSAEHPGFEKLMALYKRQGLEVQDIHDSDDFSYDKFVIWYDGNTDMTRFRRLIDGSFIYVDRGNDFAEMVPVGCSKAVGMKMIMSELNADKDDTVAFGDSLNDAEMLKAAGFGVAMGGASALYPYADYITKSLKKDGILFALKQTGML